MEWLRRRERLLIIFATALTALAFLLVCGGQSVALRHAVRVATVGGGLLLACFALDSLCRRRDYLLLAPVALLCGLGTVLLWRLHPLNASKQLIWLLMGCASMVGVCAVIPDVRSLGRHKYIWGFGAALLIGLPLLFGVEAGGSRAWLEVLPGLRFQPAEIAKILICLFLAGYISDRGRLLSTPGRRLGRWVVPRGRHVVPLVIIVVGSMALFVRQRDLGAALLLFGTIMAALYLATGRRDYPLAGLLLFVLAGAAAFHSFPHVQTRVMMWVSPWSDSTDTGYQAIQALLCLGEGGVTGAGLGLGLPNPKDVPACDTDLIFAVLGEELGLVGSLVAILLYSLIVFRLYSIAWQARDVFSQLLAACLATVFGLQVFAIIGGVTKLIPLTGVTLPFVSYGGSSLLANFVLLGLVIGVSRNDEGGVPRGHGGSAAGRPAPGGLTVENVAERTRKLACLPLTGMAVLAVFVGYWQVVRSEELRTHPLNQRIEQAAERAQRGRIMARGGQVLAGYDGSGRRVYPQGAPYAHLTGYSLRSGLERALSLPLAGLGPHRNPWEELRERERRGSDVWLTLEHAVQSAAVSRLRGHRGAAVALDPRDGAILALASTPSFDPNTVTDDAIWKATREDPDSPLINRALQGLYPPGSTFEVLVAAAALEAGVASEDEEFECPAAEEANGRAARCWNESGHGTLSLSKALQVSCGSVFAELGERLGAQGLTEFVARMPLGAQPDFPLPTAKLWWPNWSGEGSAAPGLAEVACGQGELLVTPLGMALATAVLARGGAAIHPRLVERVADDQGEPNADTVRPAEDQLVSPEVAASVVAMMEQAVEEGTGQRAALRGVRVAGKTGSAENAEGRPHAWFVALAPVEEPRVVVAVVLENAGIGGRVAAPVARKIVHVALQRD